MAKVKYYYDSDTLSYRKIKRKKATTLKYASVFLTAAALFGFLAFFIASQYIESPKERQMARELQNMELQFELLNKRTDDAFAALENVEERDNAIYRLYFEANPIPIEQRRAAAMRGGLRGGKACILLPGLPTRATGHRPRQMA